MTYCEIVKSAPEGMPFSESLSPTAEYKYYIEGKECVLGVLFEDSINVYFEWILEAGRPVAYGPEIRYKAWPKREFVRLMRMGVWNATCKATASL